MGPVALGSKKVESKIFTRKKFRGGLFLFFLFISFRRRRLAAHDLAMIRSGVGRRIRGRGIRPIRARGWRRRCFLRPLFSFRLPLPSSSSPRPRQSRSGRCTTRCHQRRRWRWTRSSRSDTSWTRRPSSCIRFRCIWFRAVRSTRRQRKIRCRDYRGIRVGICSRCPGGTWQSGRRRRIGSWAQVVPQVFPLLNINPVNHLNPLFIIKNHQKSIFFRQIFSLRNARNQAWILSSTNKLLISVRSRVYPCPFDNTKLKK